jgi:hypothetical protein
MLAAINFNNHAQFIRQKVSEVWTDWNLATELGMLELARPQ